MRVLFDIVHPAHVHFFRHLRALLEDEGHATRVVARDKEVTCRLLDELSIPYRSIGRSGRTSKVAQASELLSRVAALRKEAKGFDADIILTRNPAGVLAARTLRIPSVFDTDDGRAAGMHFKLAAPYATVVTTPASMPEDYGPRHRRYPGYKALAYLHPNRFTPDVDGVRRELDLSAGDRLFLLRLVANDAVHDGKSEGIDAALRRELVRRLSAAGRVVISAEGALQADLEQYRYGLLPHRMHDVLAATDLYLGDSGSMAAEAALLGTPSLRLSSWAGPQTYLADLEARYGLVDNFDVADAEALLARVDELLGALPEAKERSATGRAAMLADAVDVTSWYRDLVLELVG